MTKSTSRRRRGSIEIVDAKQAVDLATAQSYSENVFLFVPNLIGKLHFLCFACPAHDRPSSPRLHARHSCGFCPALHELPPNLLHPSLLRLMLAGRGRRPGGTSARTDVQVWRSVGYGHRPVRVPSQAPHPVALTTLQLYYVLLVVLPFVCVSHLCSLFPVPYRPRLQQSLYAYVQVCVLNLPARGVETDDAVQFTCNGLDMPQAGDERRQQDSLDVL